MLISPSVFPSRASVSFCVISSPRSIVSVRLVLRELVMRSAMRIVSARRESWLEPRSEMRMPSSWMMWESSMHWDSGGWFVAYELSEGIIGGHSRPRNRLVLWFGSDELNERSCDSKGLEQPGKYEYRLEKTTFLCT